MTLDELAKRIDQEIAQLHTRIDEHSNLQERQRAQYQESILAFRDTILEEIHDLKNVLEGHRFRIQSLEKHPPVIPAESPDDQTPLPKREISKPRAFGEPPR